MRRALSVLLVALAVGTIGALSADRGHAQPLADGFDFPLGPPDGTGYAPNGLGFLEAFDYGPSCGVVPHPGEDWNDEAHGNDSHDPVYAVADGVIEQARAPKGAGDSWGFVLLIRHDGTFALPEGASTTAVWSQYGHLDGISTNPRTGAPWTVGDDVFRGEQIGGVGDYPYLTGSAFHLHFEIRKQRLQSAATFPCFKNEAFVRERYTEPSSFIALNRPGPSVPRLLAFSSNRGGNFEIYSMNQDGSGVTRLTFDPAFDIEPAWSPDGTKIAFTGGVTNAVGSGDIFIMSADGSNRVNLTANSVSDLSPAWSPKGAQIAFKTNRLGNFDIWVMNADGTGATALTTHGADDVDPAWSPDAMKIVFASLRDGNSEIYVMNADGTDQSRLTNTPGVHEDQPAWSPDGARIAFRTGLGNCATFGVTIMNADGTGRLSLAAAAPGCDEEPAWSPAGSLIAFSSNAHFPRDIYTISPSGAGVTNLTNSSSFDIQPDW